jgi:hypothetical protein
MIGVQVAGLQSASAAAYPIRTSLLLWLDASDAATITSSGGLVSTWADKSGGGNNANQATGTKQPTTGSTTQNGKNVLAFDGTSDYMVSNCGVSANALTMFVVANKTAAGGAGNTYSRVVSFANSGNANDYGYNSSILFAYSQGLNAGYNPSAYAYSNSATSGLQNQYNQANASGLRVNGTSVSIYNNALSNTSTYGSISLSNDRVGLGNSFNGLADAYLNGWIAEVLVYNVSLTDTQVTNTLAYLKTKWATV